MSDREKLTELVAAFLGGLSVTDITPPYGHENLADYLLANGVVVREKGEWEVFEDCIYSPETGEDFSFPSTVCSLCGESGATEWNFCSNCGAYNRKGENDGTAQV